MEKNITNSGSKQSSNSTAQSSPQTSSSHPAKKRRTAGNKQSITTTGNGSSSTQDAVKPVIFLEFPIRIKPPPVQPTDLSIFPHRPHLVAANFDELWKNTTKKNYANYEQLVADAVIATRSDGFRAQIRNLNVNDSSVSSSEFSNSPVSSPSEPTSPVPEEFSPIDSPNQISNTDKPSTREGTPTTFYGNSNLNKSDALLFYTDDHPQNRRGFKYTHCKAVPDMYPALQYTAVEVPPYKARASYFDRCPQLALSEDALTVSTLHGFSSVRANVFVREGHWYYETKIISANTSIDLPVSASTQTINNGNNSSLGPKISGANNNCGHVRIGLSRREASLYAPVGFDAYGYGLRDTTGEAVHLSRPREFMDEGFKTDDVIGFHIYIPKVEDYIYETRKDIKDLDMINQYCTVSRDRIPIKYKNQLYFEILDYQPTSEMNNMIYSASGAKAVDILEKIPGSYIKVYKNGVPMGKAFENLISFMPPCSKHGKNKDLPPPIQPTSNTQSSSSSHTSAGSSGVNLSSQGRDPNMSLQGTASSIQRREIFSPDDGQLGYYPTISVYKGGAAQFNFGPHFDYLPDEIAQKMRFSKCSRYGSIYPVEYLKGSKYNSESKKSNILSSTNDKLDYNENNDNADQDEDEDYVIRPMCERYEEQIAEDVLYDIIDEVEFSLQLETEAQEAELEKLNNNNNPQTAKPNTNNKQLDINNIAASNTNNDNTNNNDSTNVSSVGISVATQNEKIDIPLRNIEVEPATTPVLDGDSTINNEQ